MPELRLVLLGPPGVGKGTQAKLISLRKNIPSIVTGEILRTAVAEKTALGMVADEVIKKGELVPDDVMIGLIAERFEKGGMVKGFLLDGYPRTVAQAESLDKFLGDRGTPLSAAISLVAERELVIKRIGGRLSCINCGAIFHLANKPPKVESTCDTCQSRLAVREDDQPSAVKKRMEVYEQKTAPLVAYYESTARLRTVDASGDPEQVYSAIIAGFQ